MTLSSPAHSLVRSHGLQLVSGGDDFCRAARYVVVGVLRDDGTGADKVVGSVEDQTCPRKLFWACLAPEQVWDVSEIPLAALLPAASSGRDAFLTKLPPWLSGARPGDEARPTQTVQKGFGRVAAPRASSGTRDKFVSLRLIDNNQVLESDRRSYTSGQTTTSSSA